MIQTESEWNSSATLIEGLRKEAAKRGADAVINIQETSSNKTGWTNYGNTGSGWVGGATGYYNAGTPLILPDNTTVIKVRGTAIIFTEEK